MTDITLNNGDIKLAASIHGSASGEPVLFLHGLSMSRDTWNEIATRLGDRYQAWTLDFRGHGHSARASSYKIADYIADAQAALAAIGRRTVVVGHSLGAVVAGALAQGPHPNVRAVLMEDPPWYFGERGEFERSIYPALFSVVSSYQSRFQSEGARLDTYVRFVSNAPSPMGGIASNHFGPRHLLSHASALQRQDPACWADLPNLVATLDTTLPFRCPAKVIQADPRMGAALLEGHEVRMATTNPQAEVVRYQDSGHIPHRTFAFAERFFGDVDLFITKALDV